LDPLGVKYQPKTRKKTLHLKPKSELLKEIVKISSFLNGSLSFRKKMSEKIKQKNLIFFVKKFNKS